MANIAPSRKECEAPSIFALLDELDRKSNNPGKNLRREDRRLYQRAVKILPLATPKSPIRVTTRNVTKEGLGVVSNTLLNAGDRFVFLFNYGETLVLTLCRVRHCRHIRNGFFYTGMEFQDVVRAPLGQEAIPLKWLGLQVGPDGISSSSNGRQ